MPISSMLHFNTVAILGVGLIGGSIGLGLRRRALARRVIGIGYRKESLRVARERGAVTETTLDVAAGVADADLIIVCTPVGRIVDDVRTVAANGRPGVLITDVGSTKAEIVAEVAASLPRGVTFIGSHPLAGSERSGPAAAEADLFVNRVVVITPNETVADDDVQKLTDFWSGLGARVMSMSAAEHDRALAATSHLPHLVAAALALATPAETLELTATGWADTTRVAAGDPELWRQIFASNRTALLAALARFDETLAALRTAIERRDDDKVREILAGAKERRDAVA
jgi:prephenate dehydrogenase